MKIILCSDKPEMVDSWKKNFGNSDIVSCIKGDMFKQDVEAITTSGNSFGLMDAGLDKKCLDFFGKELGEEVQRTIKENYHERINVGSAFILRTNHSKIPFFIFAPSMVVPSKLVNSLNPYLATRAVLIALTEWNYSQIDKIQGVVIPAFCTRTGGMNPSVVAYQMKEAYEEVINGRDNFQNSQLFRHYVIKNKNS